MRETPRRRRSEDDEGGGGGGLPLFPLVLAVIFGGLLLGGLLAHFFGGPRGTASVKSVPSALPTVAFTAAPPAYVRPSGLPSATPAPRPSARAATPAPKHTAAATPKPKPTPSTTAAPARAAASAKPAMLVVTPAPLRSAPARTSTPQPARSAPPRAPASRALTTPVPVTEAPAAALPAASSAASGGASGIVRAYLGALERGDRATAAGYLLRGSPTESFIDPSSSILSVRSDAIGGGSYRTTADVHTSSGEYYITFTLEPGPAGLQIADHYAIKVGP
ncbi:MAG TPA: hypothetical protein VMH02_07925 [Verrucomicrobiae bacterium]|nr:hypothetical protein [Verrucomicrobiae bacterium]